MILSSDKRWVFGSFLIFADDRFTAKKAYEMLSGNPELMKHIGTLRLADGKRVQWTNMARRPDYRFSSRRG